MNQEEINIRIDQQEKTDREQFIQLFAGWFKTLTQLPNNSSIDLSGITTTGQMCFVEIKERDDIENPCFQICYLSGATYIEKTKLDYFKDLHKTYPTAKLVYINFFKSSNSYLSFDITSRLKNRSSEILASFELLARKNNYSNVYEIKDFYSLWCDKQHLDNRDVINVNN